MHTTDPTPPDFTDLLAMAADADHAIAAMKDGLAPADPTPPLTVAIAAAKAVLRTQSRLDSGEDGTTATSHLHARASQGLAAVTVARALLSLTAKYDERENDWLRAARKAIASMFDGGWKPDGNGGYNPPEEDPHDLYELCRGRGATDIPEAMVELLIRQRDEAWAKVNLLTAGRAGAISAAKRLSGYYNAGRTDHYLDDRDGSYQFTGDVLEVVKDLLSLTEMQP